MPPRFRSRTINLALCTAAGVAIITLGNLGLAMADEPAKPAPSSSPSSPAPSTPPGTPAGGGAGGGESTPNNPERRDGNNERGGRRPAPTPGIVNVEASMKSMGRTLRQLRDQADKADKKAENLKLIGQMQEDCIAAKNAGVPAKLLKKAADDAAKAKLADTYRRDMVDLLKALIEFELSVMEDRHDDAKKGVDALLQLRQMGHQDMGIDD